MYAYMMRMLSLTHACVHIRMYVVYVCACTGRGSTNLTIRQNTIVGADHCVRVAGLDPAYAPYPRGDLVFERNLVVGCHYEGVRADKGVRLDANNVRDNLIWNAPSTHFVNTTGGENYYQSECVGGSCVTPGVLRDLHNFSFVPADRHVDPEIVDWNEHSIHFLDVHRGGVAASQSIGAGQPSDYIPVPNDQPCSNIVMNAGFASGMYGWRATGDYDLNRYSTGSGWQVIMPASITRTANRITHTYPCNHTHHPHTRLHTHLHTHP